MRKSGFVVILLCISAITLITACQPTESIAAEDLHGVWRITDFGPFLFFNEDGTFLSAWKDDGKEPVIFGQYQLDGTTVTYFLDDDSPNCPGVTNICQVEFNEDGKLQETVIESECTEVFDPGDIFIWVRHSP